MKTYSQLVAASSELEEIEDEVSDDDIHEDAILRGVLQQYGGAVGLPGSASADEALKSSLQEKLHSSNLCCLICIENIRHQDAIWSCRQCHCGFHLTCIMKWVTDGTRQRALSLETFPDQQSPWFCPKCRYEYASTDTPSTYFCYCGKERDPAFDPWIAPHSCGNTCGRPLGCGHACLLLCHPGPCPPCPQMIRDSACHCGKQKQTRRCGSQHFSCGATCNKLLGCQIHRCQAVCHTGECAPCGEQSVQPCVCGRDSRLVPCSSPVWSCNRKCGKPFACGHHTCDKVCHAGECGPCPRSGVRTCPCGKTKSNLPCTEDVPLCGNTCDKMLACGLHKCPRPCHTGPCGDCPMRRIKTCRCGSSRRELPCAQPFTCDKRCQKRRGCGRHACRRKCCDGECPPCTELCNRRLQCGNHRCAGVCHAGPCYPCSEVVELSCSCGATEVKVPCGREKHAKPLRCRALCTQPRYCRHTEPADHRCHAGECPPCRLPCGQPLPCGHACLAPCHDKRPPPPPPQTKTARKKKLKVQRQAPIPTPCPPCITLLPKMCRGGHGEQDRPCHKYADDYSCGAVCGRPLPCGRHVCEVECHATGSDHLTWAEVDARSPAGCAPVCGTCDRPCAEPRPAGCTHACPTPCHRGPCPPCDELVREMCHCGALQLNTPCHERHPAAGPPPDLAALLCCKNKCNRKLPCGHKCTLVCHPGKCMPVAACRKRVPLHCPCKRIKKALVCGELHERRQKDPRFGVACDAECAALKAAAEAGERVGGHEAAASAQGPQDPGSGGQLDEDYAARKWRRRRRRDQETIEEQEAPRHSMRNVLLGAAVVGAALAYGVSTLIASPPTDD